MSAFSGVTTHSSTTSNSMMRGYQQRSNSRVTCVLQSMATWILWRHQIYGSTNDRLLDWPLRNWNTIKFKFRFATWSWHTICQVNIWIRFRILFRRIYDVSSVCCPLVVGLIANSNYQLSTTLAPQPFQSLPTALEFFISVICIEVVFAMREGNPVSYPVCWGYFEDFNGLNEDTSRILTA